MRDVFHPAQQPHVWRRAWALFACSVWAMIAAYWLICLLAHLLGYPHPINVRWDG